MSGPISDRTDVTLEARGTKLHTRYRVDERVDVEETVTEERIRIALRSGVSTPWTSGVAAATIALTLSYSEAEGLAFNAGIALWLASTLGLLIASGTFASGVSRGHWLVDRPKIAARVYMVSGSLVACGWSATMWLFLPEASAPQQVFLVAAVAAILCGGVATQSTHAPFVRSFAVPLAAISAVALFRFGSVSYAALGVGFLVLAFHMTTFAATVQRSVSESIRLALINEQLRKEAAAQREQADALRQEAEQAREIALRADRAKATVIAATSHDLRQPLHALVQYVEHLKRSSEHVDWRGTVAKVEDSLGALQDLLDAVLDYSEATGSRLRTAHEAVDLSALVRRVESQIRPDAEAKGLRLNVTCADVTAQLDGALLQRVLVNLAQNALRYTHHGDLALRLSGGRWGARVLVADTGIGIAAELRERIFDDYFQIDNPARDRRKGLGLGLAIVRELVSALGLRVRLRSRPGVGSVFAIDIPASSLVSPKPRDSKRPERELRVSDRVQNAHVLLIDDDPLARDSLAVTLTDFGCRITSAGSADEAVRALDASAFLPHLVLSDYRLAAGETGPAAIKRVREYFVRIGAEHPELPAIIVSGDTASEVTSGVAGAVSRVLQKPLAPGVLYAALDEALGAHQASMGQREAR